MKRILLAVAFVAGTITAHAQASAVDTVTITKGYGNFSINNTKYPLNSVIVDILASDTTRIALRRLSNGLPIIEQRRRWFYRNGTTGQRFRSITEIRTYCDSFLFSH